LTSRFTLFEVSWEVCNKVGGIYTVISTKAKTAVERFGDEYVAVGPWLLADSERDVPFDEEKGFEGFCESCREMGLPVRIGRWRIPGRPRTILIEFSGLYDQRNAVLSGLWEDYGVDSISGSWDYVEPVLFGHAAGMVIEKWWGEHVAPNHRRAIVQANEWMTGSSLLYLKRQVPSIGTVFTTHATMLGRALSSLGHSPDDGLGEQTADELAASHNVVAKHSIEGVSARQADVFTTVSTITAKEAKLLHGREAKPVLPNGIDLDVIDALAGETTREKARETLQHTASRFLGEDVRDAALFVISGRYEFHNKGIDILLDALARMNGREGRRVVLFVLVPAGNSGLRGDFRERLESPAAPAAATPPTTGAIGISTHHLFDGDNDPVHAHCAKLGLTNSAASRVKIVQVPIYLHEGDGFLNLPYEAVLRAMDLSCFPSYYEPWGYTPQESLAVGVPTITTDYAGFGRWVEGQGLGPENGVTVLHRVHRQYDEVADELAGVLENYLREGPAVKDAERACRKTASRTAWSDLISNYEQAFRRALEAVQLRLEQGVPQARRPKKPLVVQPTPQGERPRLFSFDVSATLPEPLTGLRRLARNYWWCWDPEAQSVFEELSPIAWEAAGHNPVAFLRRLYPEDLQAKASDAAYVEKLERVATRFDAYVDEPVEKGRWRQVVPAGTKDPSAAGPVAYFCAEYGIHESLRIYSGGLGVLAGDHLKSASDLNLPFVAVGLFYRMGYLAQRLSPHGEQISVDLVNEPGSLPLELVREPDGKPVEVSLRFPGREVTVRAWRVAVGRVELFLLDSNVPANRPEDRDITRQLYGGDQEMRLQQEIVLGRGGVRLLRKLGIVPSVFHMNEGHAAFLTLERAGELAHKEGLAFEEAREVVRCTTLFTTHTPVPAGHDRFPEDLMRRYFSDVSDWVGVPWERFIGMGQAKGQTGTFNMTYLALYFSNYANGVSQLHGIASRKLLGEYWPGLLQNELPIRSITNGIHLPSWTSSRVGRVLGVTDRPIRADDFARELPPEKLQEIWRIKRELKADLIAKVATILRRGSLERGDSPILMNETMDGLDEDALWIGFARRFAPYKRAQLVFQDPERLRAILDGSDRPVRLIVAGKAHPRDDLGKDVLKKIAQLSREETFVGRVFFVEDYDVSLARLLVQGVDVWLNNPIRMLEASGTSGMKAAANGALNLSIGDGWWPEGYDGENGWMIGDSSRVYQQQDLQDQFDSSFLYRLLEEEVVPLFFDRDGRGFPRGWMEKVARSLRTIPPVFNTDRMVGDYLSQAYAPLGANASVLAEDKRARVKARVQTEQRVRRGFADIKIVSAQVAELTNLHVGDAVDVRVEVALGSLGADDVAVELVLGRLKEERDLESQVTVPLHPAGAATETGQPFEGTHVVDRSGSYSYGIRVRAVTEGDERPSSLRDLVLWA